MSNASYTKAACKQAADLGLVEIDERNVVCQCVIQVEERQVGHREVVARDALAVEAMLHGDGESIVLLGKFIHPAGWRARDGAFATNAEEDRPGSRVEVLVVDVIAGVIAQHNMRVTVVCHVCDTHHMQTHGMQTHSCWNVGELGSLWLSFCSNHSSGNDSCAAVPSRACCSCTNCQAKPPRRRCGKSVGRRPGASTGDVPRRTNAAAWLAIHAVAIANTHRRKRLMVNVNRAVTGRQMLLAAAIAAHEGAERGMAVATPNKGFVSVLAYASVSTIESEPLPALNAAAAAAGPR